MHGWKRHVDVGGTKVVRINITTSNGGSAFGSAAPDSAALAIRDGQEDLHLVPHQPRRTEAHQLRRPPWSEVEFGAAPDFRRSPATTCGGAFPAETLHLLVAHQRPHPRTRSWGADAEAQTGAGRDAGPPVGRRVPVEAGREGGGGVGGHVVAGGRAASVVHRAAGTRGASQAWAPRHPRSAGRAGPAIARSAHRDRRLKAMNKQLLKEKMRRSKVSKDAATSSSTPASDTPPATLAAISPPLTPPERSAYARSISDSQLIQTPSMKLVRVGSSVSFLLDRAEVPTARTPAARTWAAWTAPCRRNCRRSITRTPRRTRNLPSPPPPRPSSSAPSTGCSRAPRTRPAPRPSRPRTRPRSSRRRRVVGRRAATWRDHVDVLGGERLAHAHAQVRPEEAGSVRRVHLRNAPARPPAPRRDASLAAVPAPTPPAAPQIIAPAQGRLQNRGGFLGDLRWRELLRLGSGTARRRWFGAGARCESEFWDGCLTYVSSEIDAWDWIELFWVSKTFIFREIEPIIRMKPTIFTAHNFDKYFLVGSSWGGGARPCLTHSFLGVLTPGSFQKTRGDYGTECVTCEQSPLGDCPEDEDGCLWHSKFLWVQSFSQNLFISFIETQLIWIQCTTVACFKRQRCSDHVVLILARLVSPIQNQNTWSARNNTLRKSKASTQYTVLPEFSWMKPLSRSSGTTRNSWRPPGWVRRASWRRADSRRARRTTQRTRTSSRPTKTAKKSRRGGDSTRYSTIPATPGNPLCARNPSSPALMDSTLSRSYNDGQYIEPFL